MTKIIFSKLVLTLALFVFLFSSAGCTQAVLGGPRPTEGICYDACVDANECGILGDKGRVACKLKCFDRCYPPVINQ